MREGDIDLAHAVLLDYVTECVLDRDHVNFDAKLVKELTEFAADLAFTEVRDLMQ